MWAELTQRMGIKTAIPLRSPWRERRSWSRQDICIHPHPAVSIHTLLHPPAPVLHPPTHITDNTNDGMQHHFFVTILCVCFRCWIVCCSICVLFTLSIITTCVNTRARMRCPTAVASSTSGAQFLQTASHTERVRHTRARIHTHTHRVHYHH